jgi:acyl-CoA synthetase (AMP-forming)/AMP-acid ligase II
VIVSGGFNIWPAELEQVISALPGVREVVVFGVPDDKWGETPLAEVILDDGAALDDATVIAACVAELGSYKKPARVVFRAEPFPRSPVGKLQRKVIREPYWAGQDRGWPAPERKWTPFRSWKEPLHCALSATFRHARPPIAIGK